MVRDVVFPVVDEHTLRELIKEWKATGSTYRIKLRTVIINSYRGKTTIVWCQPCSSRTSISFQLLTKIAPSGNGCPRSVKTLCRYQGTHFPCRREHSARWRVVRGLWREAVMGKDFTRSRPGQLRHLRNRAILDALLGRRLHCNEIWLVGANCYRNPEDDLPADFEQNLEDYYRVLNLPLDAESFMTNL